MDGAEWVSQELHMSPGGDPCGRLSGERSDIPRVAQAHGVEGYLRRGVSSTGPRKDVETIMD